MTTDEDHELLRAFVDEGSEAAFCGLVERHLGLVSRIVLRRISNKESAQDVIQVVFGLLARKASTLIGHPTITGWLVKTAMFECSKHNRKEASRMKRESIAAEQEQSLGQDARFSEEEFSLVEAALSDLPARFRDAIMMRYYQGDSFKKIGSRLGSSEGAAQKLVSRSVERLRQLVNRRHTTGGFNSATFSLALTSALTIKPVTGTAAGSLGLGALHSAASLAKSSILLNTLYTAMTATQIKVTVGLGLLVTLPLAYHLGDRYLNSRSPSGTIVSEAPDETERSPSESEPEPNKQTVRNPNPREVGTSPAQRAVENWKERRGHRLIGDLSDEEWKIRRGAALALKEDEVPAELAVPALIEALSDEQWHVRKAVAGALAYYGPESAPAVPELIRALADEEWHVRAPAAEALGAIGEQAKDAVPNLADALSDEEWQVRNPAAMALAMIGADSAPAVPALRRALADEQWHVATNAGAALAAIGAQAASAVPELMEALNHEEWHVRSSAAYALGAIGPAATEAIDSLSSRLSDGEDRVREIAKEAIERIQDSE